jgi:hypothetical protein
MEWKEFTAIGMFSFAIAGGLLTAGGLIYALRGVINDVKELKEQMDCQKSTVQKHVGDNEAHVNHLYMKGIEKRLDSLEVAVIAGHQRIEDKLDRMNAKTR